MEEEFMKYVQEHERQWGTAAYQDRPDLMQIMAAHVVVFWRPMLRNPDPKKPADNRNVITLHNDMVEVEKYLVTQVMRATLAPPERKFVAAFMNKRKLKVKQVKIVFEFADNGGGG
jgi:hypothetical protein